MKAFIWSDALCNPQFVCHTRTSCELRIAQKIRPYCMTYIYSIAPKNASVFFVPVENSKKWLTESVVRCREYSAGTCYGTSYHCLYQPFVIRFFNWIRLKSPHRKQTAPCVRENCPARGFFLSMLEIPHLCQFFLCGQRVVRVYGAFFHELRHLHFVHLVRSHRPCYLVRSFFS